MTRSILKEHTYARVRRECDVKVMDDGAPKATVSVTLLRSRLLGLPYRPISKGAALTLPTARCGPVRASCGILGPRQRQAGILNLAYRLK